MTSPEADPRGAPPPRLPLGVRRPGRGRMGWACALAVILPACANLPPGGGDPPTSGDLPFEGSVSGGVAAASAPLVPAPGGPGLVRRFLGLGGPACREAGSVVRLPPAVRESSGVALAGTPDPGLTPSHAGPDPHPGDPEALRFWTHNDSGWPAEIVRVDARGQLLDRVEVSGATNLDWEDMAAGPCPADAPGVPPARPALAGPEPGPGRGGGEGRCLYVADTGDNRETRPSLEILRIPEPVPGETRSAEATRFPLHLPHGPRDIEALALLPGEHLLLITKGKNHPVEVYRVRGPLGEAPRPLQAELVARLTGGRPGFRGYVTGAATTRLAPGETLVAVRTYMALSFYRVEVEAGEGSASGIPTGLVPVEGSRVNLLPLREPQGEAVGFAGGGLIVLTSEGGPAGGPASLRLLDCSVGFRRWGLTR